MDHECTCNGPGMCPKFNKRMTERRYEICSGRFRTGAAINEAARNQYLRQWYGIRPAPAAPQRRDPPALRTKMRGAGDAVGAVTKFFGIRECGGCKKRKRLLNRWLPLDRSVTDIATGITTAKRTRPTLDRSLESIKRAGFGEPWVFCEPDAPVPEQRHYKHRERMGSFTNCIAGIAALVQAYPDATHYCMFQDDVLVTPDLWPWLRDHLPSAEDCGVISLWLMAPDHRRIENGWHSYDPSKLDKAHGALAYLFYPEAAQRIVDNLMTDTALNNLDGRVAYWCKQTGLKYWYHCPSFTKHIGETSTVARHDGIKFERQCREWVRNPETMECVPCR